MTILYITNGISGPGGLERVLSIKTKWWIEQQSDVHIFTINDTASKPFYDFHERIKFHNTDISGNPIQFHWNYAIAIKRIVKQVSPDIISVCDDGLKGFFVPKILKTNIPIVYERHASINISKKQGISNFSIQLKHWIMKKLAFDFDKFIILTESNRKEWISGNLQVIPNPISFSNNEISSLENKKLISVGSLGYNKGTDLLINIWHQVHAKFPEWELNLYGKLVNIDQYKAQAESLGVKRLIFNPPEQNIQERFIESSIALVPSRSEGFGMVIIEAMQCGLPVVSFDCPHGPGDIISNGQDGYLIPPLDIKKFAEKLEDLMSEQELRQELAKNAKEKAKTYAVDSIMHQWNNLFNSLIK